MNVESVILTSQLNTPDLPETHNLYPVLSSAFKHRSLPAAEGSNASESLWPASYFGLDRLSIFAGSGEEEKLDIVGRCCRSILNEAYFIEKSGMSFTAKMSLLSETAQESMLYSMFAADEAVHFHWINSYIPPQDRRNHPGPFIQLLDEILRKEDRTILNYVVQIVLEGWGISHYHSLAGGCRAPGLRAIFENIIRDEGRHHSSGLILFNERKPDDAGLKRISDILAQILIMVQAGPQMVVSNLEQVKGHLSRHQRIRVFEELDCETSTAGKLGILKSLIKNAACSEKMLELLDKNGSFRPFTPAECSVLLT